MTTVADWIDETRDHLEGERTEEANQLASPYAAGSGGIVLSNALGNIGPGARLSIGTNTLLVTAVNQLAKAASVIGGHAGSIDADADTGALVRVNPRFTDWQILREINRHLSTLSSPKVGLFRVGTSVLDYGSPVEGYDLSGVTGLVKVLEVRRQTIGPSLAWPVVEAEGWDVLWSAPSDFPSGYSLRLVGAETGRQVQVVYAYGFTPTTDVAADVSVTGISATQEDIPPLGAAVRLMSGREVSRNSPTSQGDARRSQEVGPGAVLRSYQGLVALWQTRVAEESARLRNRYPMSI